jgi:SAM-dependent methyltransferase
MSTTRRQLLLASLSAALCTWAGRAHAARGRSVFHAVYDDPELAERFFPFLVNVFQLRPEDAFHQLIADAVAAHPDDASIYRAIADGLGEVTPFHATFTYAIPALRTQKQVLGEQTAALLAGRTSLNGYVEIGTNGSYIEPVRSRVDLDGPVVLLTDQPQTYSPAEMIQRGSVRRNATYVPLGDYDPVAREAVPDASVDLVSSYIGFHHAPPERLEAFVDSLVRILRPGGRLVLREHDVDDAVQHDLVDLAHDVFNVGTYLSWETNEAQLRHFRSVSDWERLMASHGLQREEGHALQEGDPTDNALLIFAKA